MYFCYAADVMYIDELIPDLVKSLVLLSGPSTTIYIAHGRNRPAEATFVKAAHQHFTVEHVPDSELDEVYRCSDVDVLKLSPHGLQHKQQKQKRKTGDGDKQQVPELY